MHDLYDIALVANISVSYVLWIIALLKFDIKNRSILVLLTSLIYMMPVVYYLAINGVKYLSIAVITWFAIYMGSLKLRTLSMAIITPLPLIICLVYYIVAD